MKAVNRMKCSQKGHRFLITDQKFSAINIETRTCQRCGSIIYYDLPYTKCSNAITGEHMWFLYNTKNLYCQRLNCEEQKVLMKDE